MYSGECAGKWSRDCGVGHEPDSLTDVRGTEATSWEYDRPAGVAFTLQVCRNSVEPRDAIRARNLLPKKDVRAALAEEMEEGWPEVPLVSSPSAAACRGERLAGTARGPDGTLVGPSGETEGSGPAADAGEEMELSVLAEIVGSDIADIPLVDVADSDEARRDEASEPPSSERIILVIVSG